MKKRMMVMMCTLFMTLLVTSCGENNKFVAPEKISFSDSISVIRPGTYSLSAAIEPPDSPQDVNFILDGFSTGVEINENKLIVSDTVIDGITITVKAVSKYDLQLYDVLKLSVENPVGNWVDIYTEEGLSNISKNLKANYRLMNDIELTKPWHGIGVAETTEDGVKKPGEGFAGVFNGNGYSITGFSMPESTGYNKAFFNQTEETAVVENLGIMGTVQGANWCSALVGVNKGTVMNCAANVNVIGKGAPNSAFVSVNKGSIMYCYAVGRVSVGESKAGHGAGFVNSNSGSIVSCYALEENIAYAVGYKSSVDSTITKSENEMRKVSTYSSWDQKTWCCEDGKIPALRSEKFSKDSEYVITAPLKWIEVSNQQELINIANNLSGNYRLTADIELEGEWKGIGRAESVTDGVKDYGEGFAGKLDGNGFCISGLNISDSQGYNLALFSQTEPTALIENLSLTGMVQGANWCSALVGINKGIIRNCMTDVKVSGKSAPSSAFVGTNYGTISFCYSIGEVVTGPNQKGHSGGFVSNNRGVIESSFALNKGIKYAMGYQSVLDTAIQKNEKEMTTSATYAKWNRDIWLIEDGKFPILK